MVFDSLSALGGRATRAAPPLLLRLFGLAGSSPLSVEFGFESPSALSRRFAIPYSWDSQFSLGTDPQVRISFPSEIQVTQVRLGILTWRAYISLGVSIVSHWDFQFSLGRLARSSPTILGGRATRRSRLYKAES